MELHAHKPWLVMKLHNLHQLFAGAETGQGQALFLEKVAVLVVELIAVAVALIDHGLAVGLVGEGILAGDLAGIRAQTHGAALIGHVPLLGHQVNDGILRIGKLAGMGVGNACHMARKLDHCHLHAQANAEKRDVILPGVANGGDHTLNAPVAKAARHKDAVYAAQMLPCILVGHLLGIHPTDVDVYIVFNAAVGQRLHHGQIGIVELDVFTHQRDLNGVFAGLGPLHHGRPLGQIRLGYVKVQPAADHFSQSLVLQHQRNLIEDGCVEVGNHRVGLDVAEQGNLIADVLGNGLIGPADNHIGLNANGQKFLAGVLGRLTLELIRAGNGHHQGNMDVHHVLPGILLAHLTNGLQERLGLDIAHGAADLGNHHVGIGGLAHPINTLFDLVGNVGDYLNGAAQIIAAALPVQHGPVDLAGGHRGIHGQILIGKPLVMSQIQIRLRAVIGDKHLAMLERAHGAGIHIQIGIELLDRHLQAPLLEQTTKARRRNTLAKPGYYAAGHEDIFHCHTLRLHRKITCLFYSFGSFPSSADV